MKHLILGTAGHIDHGKTSLVRALTGIDTDRLKEEQKRGITIELGFAHLPLDDDTTIGIVDVPGHEKFIRTMVAGVAGMDLVMLVIAADEGIMPQTREHLDILRLLGVKQGLVVLTKSDRVDDEWLELVTEEVRDFVADTFFAAAPIVAVSSRTGKGLDLLKTELAALTEKVVPKDREGHFRLPIDRVFTITGFGTVVTGTLLAGTIKIGDEVELLPSGRTGKVRGIQAHGKQAETGQAGQRLAINLQGIAHELAARGDLLVPPKVFRTTRRIDVRLEHLASAPKELKHRTRARLHTGTSDISAQIVLFDHNLLQPGETAYAQLRLAEPLVLVSGDPCLLRTSSHSATIGGAVVLDPFPPAHRRRSDEAVALLQALDATEHQRTCALIVSQARLSGISIENIQLRSGIPRRQLDAALQQLLAKAQLIQMTRDPRIFLTSSAVEELKQLLMSELEKFMQAASHASGIGKEELKSRLPERSDPRFFAPLLAMLEKENKVIVDRELIKPVNLLRKQQPKQHNLADKIVQLLDSSGKEPPTTKELATMLACTEKECLANLAALSREGQITKIAGNLFYSNSTVAKFQQQLLDHLHEHGEITPAVFRELTELSRKYMIPLLEYFDQQKLTIRVGDKRILRGSL
ncbi:MAG: selenocysteine-specific translation elongation factor [Trichlorobacter sp.]|jgi:selenocysteine-specific elongation factor|nr:selenocysteine-specific translation elongation factor [Trichlorobacter sp.]